MDDFVATQPIQQCIHDGQLKVHIRGCNGVPVRAEDMQNMGPDFFSIDDGKPGAQFSDPKITFLAVHFIVLPLYRCYTLVPSAK